MDWDKMVKDMSEEINEYRKLEVFHTDIFNKLKGQGFPPEAILTYALDQLSANGINITRTTVYFFEKWKESQIGIEPQELS